MTAIDDAILKFDRRGRLRYSAKQKTAMVDAYQSSGLSGPRFAALHGVNYQTLAGQLAKRKRAAPRKPPGLQHPAFLEAEEVTLRLLEPLAKRRAQVGTMTFDNGKEFALHELLAEVLDVKAYFAHPHHSWERRPNESTKGLIRPYFPKGSSFDHLTIVAVKRVEQLLNTCPQKCLAYQTPIDILKQLLPIALAA